METTKGTVKKLKTSKKLKPEQMKPEMNTFHLIPKFTGKGYTEGKEEKADMMVYTDGTIAVFAPLGVSLKESARYVLFNTVEEFAENFDVIEADKELLRARIGGFLKMINAAA